MSFSSSSSRPSTATCSSSSSSSSSVYNAYDEYTFATELADEKEALLALKSATHESVTTDLRQEWDTVEHLAANIYDICRATYCPLEASPSQIRHLSSLRILHIIVTCIGLDSGSYLSTAWSCLVTTLTLALGAAQFASVVFGWGDSDISPIVLMVAVWTTSMGAVYALLLWQHWGTSWTHTFFNELYLCLFCAVLSNGRLRKLIPIAMLVAVAAAAYTLAGRFLVGSTTERIFENIDLVDAIDSSVLQIPIWALYTVIVTGWITLAIIFYSGLMVIYGVLVAFGLGPASQSACMVRDLIALVTDSARRLSILNNTLGVYLAIQSTVQVAVTILAVGTLLRGSDISASTRIGTSILLACNLLYLAIVMGLSARLHARFRTLVQIVTKKYSSKLELPDSECGRLYPTFLQHVNSQAYGVKIYSDDGRVITWGYIGQVISLAFSIILLLIGDSATRS